MEGLFKTKFLRVRSAEPSSPINEDNNKGYNETITL
jgi:hypothetical protein